MPKADNPSKKIKIEYGILKSFSDNGINPSKISDYFESKLAPDERDRIEDSLVEVEKSLDPKKDISEIYDDLDSINR